MISYTIKSVEFIILCFTINELLYIVFKDVYLDLSFYPHVIRVYKQQKNCILLILLLYRTGIILFIKK